MLQSPSLIRQQQQQRRVSRYALISALGSFLIGLMLPWSLRTSNFVHSPSAPQAPPGLVAPSFQATQPQQQNPSSSAPNTSESLSESSSPSDQKPLLANLSALKSASIDPRELPSVGQTITQRVDGLQASVARLKERRFENRIPQRFVGKSVKELEIPIDQKVIALTFDDGPWPKITEQVLDILRKDNIKATFFWVGQALNNSKDIGKKVAAEGHVIANHTWHHRYHQHDEAAAAREINQTANLIQEVVGIQTTIFRPPGGVENNGLVDYALRNNYVNIMWSSDSRDWNSSAPAIKSNVLNSIKPGRIILLHDGGGNRIETVKALPDIIAEIKKQGYRFVTIPELLEMADQHLAKQESEAKKQSLGG